MKLKSRLTLAILSSMLVGGLSGILLQKYHVPGAILTGVTTYYHHLRLVSSVAHPNESVDRSIRLKTRTFDFSEDEANYDTERSSTYIYQTRELDVSKTALMLVDVWASHPNDGLLERTQENIKSKIVPLLELARNNGLTIIHAPHDQEIAEDCKPLPGELVMDSGVYLDSTAVLDRYLKDHGITTLLYAGYHTNMCILWRPTGIIKMSQLGYEVILVRDCTVAFETPETVNERWVEKVTISMIEFQYGSTTTLQDLQEAFGER